MAICGWKTWDERTQKALLKLLEKHGNEFLETSNGEVKPLALFFASIEGKHLIPELFIAIAKKVFEMRESRFQGNLARALAIDQVWPQGFYDLLVKLRDKSAKRDFYAIWEEKLTAQKNWTPEMWKRIEEDFENSRATFRYMKRAINQQFWPERFVSLINDQWLKNPELDRNHTKLLLKEFSDSEKELVIARLSEHPRFSWLSPYKNRPWNTVEDKLSCRIVLSR